MYKIIHALMHRLGVDLEDGRGDDDGIDDTQTAAATAAVATTDLSLEQDVTHIDGAGGLQRMTSADLGGIDLDTLFRTFDMPNAMSVGQPLQHQINNPIFNNDATTADFDYGNDAAAAAAATSAAGIPDDLFGIFGINWNLDIP